MVDSGGEKFNQWSEEVELDELQSTGTKINLTPNKDISFANLKKLFLYTFIKVTHTHTRTHTRYQI